MSPAEIASNAEQVSTPDLAPRAPAVDFLRRSCRRSQGSRSRIRRQRLAGVHLRHVVARMQGIALLELAAEAFRRARPTPWSCRIPRLRPSRWQMISWVMCSCRHRFHALRPGYPSHHALLLMTLCAWRPCPPAGFPSRMVAPRPTAERTSAPLWRSPHSSLLQRLGHRALAWAFTSSLALPMADGEAAPCGNIEDVVRHVP